MKNGSKMIWDAINSRWYLITVMQLMLCFGREVKCGEGYNTGLLHRFSLIFTYCLLWHWKLHVVLITFHNNPINLKVTATLSSKELFLKWSLSVFGRSLPTFTSWSKVEHFWLSCLSVSRLTFLVLQPELLLGLLAGEVDAAAELGAVQGFRHIVAAILLEESQQLLTSALCRQGLQDLRKAW